MYSKKIEHYKETLQLNDLQRSILIGLLLGDGHLETQNNGRTYRLKVEQSEDKSEYVKWLYQHFENLVLSPPKEKEKFRNGVRTKSIGFSTCSLGILRFYGQQFYRNGRKRVPKILGKLLTPIGIAVWFMDDGSIKSRSHQGKILNTQCFSKQEVLFLMDVLLRTFSLETRLRRQKDGYQIYILSQSMQKFRELIDEYILESMRYKLD